MVPWEKGGLNRFRNRPTRVAKKLSILSQVTVKDKQFLPWHENLQEKSLRQEIHVSA